MFHDEIPGFEIADLSIAAANGQPAGHNSAGRAFRTAIMPL
jgi:hypothetical protein